MPITVAIPDQHLLFAIVSFILGSVVGSFLNVCIYRLPRNMSVASPSRSFCPTCKTTLGCTDNVPILAWLLLGGKCRYCKSPISSRYAIVEFLTGMIFLATWLSTPSAVAIAGFVFFSILITATFVDIEHEIIPAEVTYTGIGSGLILAALIPSTLGQTNYLDGFLQGLLGAGVGVFAVFFALNLGKTLFGKVRRKLPTPVSFSWKKNDGGAPELKMAGDVEDWDDLFFRESDRLRMECPDLKVAGFPPGKGTVSFGPKGLYFEKRFIPYHDLESVSGKVSIVTIPREAMGVGDIKLMAAIGTFVGWKGTIFTLAFSSFFGILGYVATRIWLHVMTRKAPPSARIRYGPYISLAAAMWWFCGPSLLNWYLTKFFQRQ